jgi:structural maintenance of chromosome 1
VQTQKSHDASQKEATRLSSLIEVTEDKMFAAFCKKIHVDNIRDYEGRQLKHAEEENEARLRFRTQLARLNNQ